MITGKIVLPDHYATLGIAPHSPPAAIRTAYVQLMRRYHPDRNQSVAGEARAREITVAYAILGVADRRAAYDVERTRQFAAERFLFVPQQRQWRLKPLLAIFSGIAAVVLLLPLLISPASIPFKPLGPISSTGAPQQAVSPEQVGNVTARNAAGSRAADGAADMASLLDEELITVPPTGVAQMPEATDRFTGSAAPRNGAPNERVALVEQISAPAAQEPTAAHPQRVQPRPKPPQPRTSGHAQAAQPSAGAGQAPAVQQPKPVWLRPLPATKPAWQRPLPPITPAWQRPLAPPATTAASAPAKDQ